MALLPRVIVAVKETLQGLYEVSAIITDTSDAQNAGRQFIWLETDSVLESLRGNCGAGTLSYYDKLIQIVNVPADKLDRCINEIFTAFATIQTSEHGHRSLLCKHDLSTDTWGLPREWVYVIALTLLEQALVDAFLHTMGKIRSALPPDFRLIEPTSNMLYSRGGLAIRGYEEVGCGVMQTNGRCGGNFTSILLEIVPGHVRLDMRYRGQYSAYIAGGPDMILHNDAVLPLPAGQTWHYASGLQRIRSVAQMHNAVQEIMEFFLAAIIQPAH